jgi:hypothetical protein
MNKILVYVKIVLKFVQHHSWRDLLRRIWLAATEGIFAKRNTFILKLRTEEAAEPTPGLELRELTRSDINQMLEIMYLRRVDLYDRFSCGERCFAVMDGGKIASYFWAQFEVRYLRELFWKFKLKSSQVWLYNAVTVKSARGRGYYPNIIRYMAKVLRVEGFDELFIDVEERNKASIRGVEKAGCKRVVKVQMKKLLSRVKYKVTIFDKDTWRRLSEAISDYSQKQCIMEEKVNGS